jgi:deazaflavin-dependent oxidoreductase (nitroreductase family)
MRWYRSFAGWVGDRPWFRPIATRVLPRVDKLLLHLRGWYLTPFPTLLLTTTGAKSGEPHEAPLYYLNHDGYVVIATNYGRQEPDWSRNLRADSNCSLLVGKTSLSARADQADGQHWDQYLEQFADFYPPYRAYVARAGRQIPIWKLTPTQE